MVNQVNIGHVYKMLVRIFDLLDLDFGHVDKISVRLLIWAFGMLATCRLGFWLVDNMSVRLLAC